MQILSLKEKPDYIPTLAQWHHSEWQHLNPGQSLQDRIDKMQAYLNDDFIPSTYIALEDMLLGSASIVKHDMDTRKDLSPWLASVYVEPAHRRKGAGSALVQHVMDEAMARGIKTLYLFTEDETDYYQQLGWYTYEKANYRGHKIQIMSTDLNP